MHKILLVLVLLLPVLLMASPQPGDTAPSVTLPDTANVSHVVPGDYVHHVLHLIFWQSA